LPENNRVETFDFVAASRIVRILVVPSKTFFFLNKGDTLGLTAETGQEFEKWINKRHAQRPFDIKVVFVPTRRDRIFQDLIDGKGDVAAADLTITTERSAAVDRTSALPNRPACRAHQCLRTSPYRLRRQGQ